MPNSGQLQSTDIRCSTLAVASPVPDGYSTIAATTCAPKTVTVTNGGYDTGKVLPHRSINIIIRLTSLSIDHHRHQFYNSCYDGAWQGRYCYCVWVVSGHFPYLYFNEPRFELGTRSNMTHQDLHWRTAEAYSPLNHAWQLLNIFDQPSHKDRDGHKTW